MVSSAVVGHTCSRTMRKMVTHGKGTTVSEILVEGDDCGLVVLGPRKDRAVRLYREADVRGMHDPPTRAHVREPFEHAVRTF